MSLTYVKRMFILFVVIVVLVVVVVVVEDYNRGPGIK
jgi:hypothetical protein